MSPRHLAAVASVVLGLGLATTACATGGGSTATPALAGMVRTPTPTIVVPTVEDSDGQPVEFAAPPGGMHLVYFGYTNCPDICPTTFADLRAALDDLGGDAERVRISFVTVDPERDTAAVMRGYLGSFFASATPLRVPDPAGLAALTDAFGASFTRSTTADGRVEVSHSAFLYALDTEHRLIVQWPFGTTRRELTADLELLLDRLEPT